MGLLSGMVGLFENICYMFWEICYLCSVVDAGSY